MQNKIKINKKNKKRDCINNQIYTILSNPFVASKRANDPFGDM